MRLVSANTRRSASTAVSPCVDEDEREPDWQYVRDCRRRDVGEQLASGSASADAETKPYATPAHTDV